MLKPEQIPDEVVEAMISHNYNYRSAIAAAINAWPGMEIEVASDDSEFVILPLPTEPRDE